MQALMSFLTPSKKAIEVRKKKSLSFGAPQYHQFDTMSPARRRKPAASDSGLNAENVDVETLQMEILCRQDEGESTELDDVDVNTQSKKSLVKMVNKLWNQDQIAKLEERGLSSKADQKRARPALAHRMVVMEELERKANVLMSGEHTSLPSKLPLAELKKELEGRRIKTDAPRQTLELRLEEAWLKEGSRFDVKGEDGYAFGRHAVSARDVVEEMPNKELRIELLQPHWGLSKSEIPAKRAERMDMLEAKMMGQMKQRRDMAFDIVLTDQLQSAGLETMGPKGQRFDRLANFLPIKAEASAP